MEKKKKKLSFIKMKLVPIRKRQIKKAIKKKKRKSRQKKTWKRHK